jgi:ethanolamine permease
MAVFGAVIAYAMQMVSYLVLKRNFADIERPFVSPLGSPGAVIALVIALAALVALFVNPDFRRGVIGVAVWFLAGLCYFGFYARNHMVRSPEESFAVAQKPQA